MEPWFRCTLYHITHHVNILATTVLADHARAMVPLTRQIPLLLFAKTPPGLMAQSNAHTKHITSKLIFIQSLVDPSRSKYMMNKTYLIEHPSYGITLVIGWKMLVPSWDIAHFLEANIKDCGCVARGRSTLKEIIFVYGRVYRYEEILKNVRSHYLSIGTCIILQQIELVKC